MSFGIVFPGFFGFLVLFLTCFDADCDFEGGVVQLQVAGPVGSLEDLVFGADEELSDLVWEPSIESFSLEEPLFDEGDL